ncbi:Bifunctional purine biosynthetic protein Ade5,7 [Malassezia pachydermatis]|uniref:phosphoribosylglycinamide formyltransferase 1 n=1 Tax=Malassezia pachydermatis TaxID=77020 RepID=A0A0M8MMG9_9BASI|nr:phosphoribosylglycinamide formyltransferase [Malassezia pachydermatis]KOS13097.1 phosphoribosylglycinamide formyltransferase [Malassezia pachydermatis]
MSDGVSDSKADTSPSRAKSLLSRYGGENGPTGHASMGDSESPVSLSSFIGGKAQTPRLGKLAGDGRTSMSPDSEKEFQGLPGMAKPGSMASFMEQRQREMFPEHAKEAVSPPSELGPEPAAKQEKKETPSVTSLPKRSTSGKEMVVLISGSGSNLQALIDATCGDKPVIPDAQIVRVISNRMKVFGLERARNVEPPIPTQVHSLKTYQNRNPGKTRDDYDLVLAERVLGEGRLPDLIVLAGFMHIVSETFLSALGHETSLASPPAFSKRPPHPIPIINLHPALPGAFDGAGAIERAYEAFQEGKIEHTGVMVHKVVAEVDRGAPIIVRKVPIYKEDSLDDLETRMHSVEHEIIVEAAAKVLAGAEEMAVEPVPPVHSQEPTVFLRWGKDKSWTPVPQPLVVYDSDVIWVQGATPFLWLGHAVTDGWDAVLPKGDCAKIQASATIIHQGREPTTFLQVVGGVLVTRQGEPDASEPTEQLFTVRHGEHGIYIDEVAFAAASVSAAFSAVACTSRGLFVWHGLGSGSEQREHATKWARLLGSSSKELDSSSFFALFKDDVYADGWHHRHRTSLPPSQREAVMYSPASSSAPVPFSLGAIQSNAITLVDGRLEIYVIVGAQARGDRKGIDAALARAEKLAQRSDPTQMQPAIHVLVLPSVAPLDLVTLARDPWYANVFTAEADKSTAIFMNVHSLAEAKAQLAGARPAPPSTLPTNRNFLPVGVQPGA